jgi:uncharacterized RDD family membrane protein YckC
LTVSGLFPACNGPAPGPDTVCAVSQPSEAAPGTTYPGERLGLPESGPGSVASWTRRVLALFIDWLAARLVAGLFIGAAIWSGNGVEQLWVFAVYVVEAGALTALLGGSFGQLVCRVAVVRLDGRPLPLIQALVRTILICLVIPPLVFNRDRRGLHDLAVGSITLRR